jgi:hypothetical protein
VANTYSGVSSGQCTACPNGTDTAGATGGSDVGACLGTRPYVCPPDVDGWWLVTRWMCRSVCAGLVLARQRRRVHAYAHLRMSGVMWDSADATCGRPACPANTYSAAGNGTGAAECLPCPAGTDTRGSTDGVDIGVCLGTDVFVGAASCALQPRPLTRVSMIGWGGGTSVCGGVVQRRCSGQLRGYVRWWYGMAAAMVVLTG